jgi:hypothetical protein
MELLWKLKFDKKFVQIDDIPTLFVSRMLVIYLVFIRGIESVSPPFLSFFFYLDDLGRFPGLFIFLSLIFKVSLVFVFLGLKHRTFAFILGLLIIFMIISNRILFSNSLLYSGLVLFFIGLYKPGLEWIFRAQFFFLYVGAGINKLFDYDWLNGQYIMNFFSSEFSNSFVISIFEVFPDNSGAIFMSFLVISTEIGLGIGAWFSSRKIIVFLLIFIFHLAMLFLTKGELSLTFFFLMASTSPLILIWRGQNMGVSSASEGKINQKFSEGWVLELLFSSVIKFLQKKKILSTDYYFYSKNRVNFEIFYGLLIITVFILFSI